MVQKARMSSNVYLASLFLAVASMAGCGGGGSDSTPEVPGPPVQPPTPSSPPPAPTVPDPLRVETSFGNSGNLTISLAPYGGLVTKMVQQADGKLVVGGHRKLETMSFGGRWRRTKTTLFVHRYLDSGQLDTGFGSNGVVEFSLRGADQMQKLALGDNGEIYAQVMASVPCEMRIFAWGISTCLVDGQSVLSSEVVAKIAADGKLDMGASDSGVDQSQWPSAWRVEKATGREPALQTADGRYLYWGTVRARGFYPPYDPPIIGSELRKYLPDGTLDASFASNGIAKLRCKSATGKIIEDAQRNLWLIAVQQAANTPLNAPLILGLCAEKLSSQGAISPSMQDVIEKPLGSMVGVSDAKVLDDGALMIVMNVAKPNAPVIMEHRVKGLKFAADGQPVRSYGVDGVADFAGLTPSQAQLMQVKITNGVGDAAGARQGMESAGVMSPNVWAKWLPDGSMNPQFGTNGLLTLEGLPPNSSRSMVLVDAKKRWLMQQVVAVSADSDSPVTVTFSRLEGESQ
ncbi:MAG: hypothetical protein RSD57_14710 [Comamonas sp.]